MPSEENQNEVPIVDDLNIEDEYLVISEDKTVFDAAVMIRDNEIPDIVVIDNKKFPLGVISDYEITTKVVAEGKDPQSAVSEAMYKIQAVTPATPVREVFDLLIEHNVPVVPVVKDNKLIGVVSIQDCWDGMPEED